MVTTTDRVRELLVRHGVDADVADQAVQDLPFELVTAGDIDALERRFSERIDRQEVRFDEKIDELDKRQNLRHDQHTRDIAELKAAVQELNDKVDRQGERLDAKIDDQGAQLDAKIDDQGARLEAKIEAQGARLEAKIEAQGARLEALGAQLNDKIDARSKELNDKLDTHFHRLIVFNLGLIGIFAAIFGGIIAAFA